MVRCSNFICRPKYNFATVKLKLQNKFKIRISFYNWSCSVLFCINYGCLQISIALKYVVDI